MAGKNNQYGYIITGTNTDIGKTIFAAGLVGMLGVRYWKPVQAGAGDDGLTDSELVRRLSGASHAQILPEAYRLQAPLSPDQAARLEGCEIDPDALSLLPNRPLIIEGAGGALVPLNDETLYADIFARWGLPVIIVASTKLGTINHSLLTIEALRARGCDIHGIAFIGDAQPASEASIIRHGAVRRLGRLPWIDPLNADTLAAGFAKHFSRDDFR